jgi:hypothetical protein
VFLGVWMLALPQKGLKPTIRAEFEDDLPVLFFSFFHKVTPQGAAK